MLARELEAALRRLNPGLPDEAYSQAIDKLTATTATKTLFQTNRELAGLIKSRVPVTFKDVKGDTSTERLRVIDFEVAENNDFLVVRELWVKVYRRRADLVGFVNGFGTRLRHRTTMACSMSRRPLGSTERQAMWT